MTVVPFPGSPDIERTLCRAIETRRLVAFVLQGFPRRAEPHDLGIVHGVKKLFFYQAGGRSRSGRPFGWRWAALRDIRDLQVLDEQFDGPRDAHTAHRVQWDRLIASVSRRV
jgi:hypothetical protein